MKDNLLKYLCCPINRDELILQQVVRNESGGIISGTLKSKEGQYYPIIDGIPRLLPNPSINGNNNSEYKRLTKPYDEYLIENGISPSEIAKMDSLRYSIFSLTHKFIKEYLNGTVLDLGAGNDYLKKEFLNLSDFWISLDYNIRSNTIDVQGDGQFLPFPENLFDTIVSIDVLEHIPDPDKLVSELYRVLKPGGKIILSTPFFFWHHEEPFDFFRFSRYGIRTIFEKNNFKVLQVEPIAGVLSIGGLLISVFITKIFKNMKLLLLLFLKINKMIQLKIIYPLDKKIDKRKRFAQGHFIIATKPKEAI
jgi:SAM-dependent methyltransferase